MRSGEGLAEPGSSLAALAEPPARPAPALSRGAEPDAAYRIRSLVGNPGLARVARVVLLLAVDVLALFLAAAVAYFVWARPVRTQPAETYLGLLPWVVLFLIGYAQGGLYPGLGLGPVEMLRRTSRATVFGFVLLATVTFVMKLPQVYSRATFGIAFALSLILVPVVRIATSRLLKKVAWLQEPIIVVGTGVRAHRAIEATSGTATMGYRPIAAVSLDADSGAEQGLGIPVLSGLDRAAELAEAGVQVAIVELDDSTDRSLVDKLQRSFRHVIMLRDFDDLPIENVEIRNFGGFMGIEYTNNLLKLHNRAIKRTMDLILGSIGLTLALPVIALAALAVKVASPGPAFYRQRRTGFNGAPFPVIKIRTMRPDADQLMEEYIKPGSPMHAEWQERKKLSADPRLIPGVGRLLRRWSIDELPQLWSVVLGTMTLVGPRPLPDYHLKEFTPTFRDLRQRVRPGVTGMWQVMIRSEGGLKEQEAFDSYYIRNWSVWLDVYILSKTVTAVLTGRGAY